MRASSSSCPETEREVSVYDEELQLSLMTSSNRFAAVSEALDDAGEREDDDEDEGDGGERSVEVVHDVPLVVELCKHSFMSTVTMSVHF